MVEQVEQCTNFLVKELFDQSTNVEWHKINNLCVSKSGSVGDNVFTSHIIII